MPDTRVTPEQVAVIRSGVKTDAELAKVFGLSHSYVNGIRLGHYLRDPGEPAPERNHRSGGARTNFRQVCECGQCGEMTSPGRRYVYGHYARVMPTPVVPSMTDEEWLSRTLSNTVSTDCGYKNGLSPCLLWTGLITPNGHVTATRRRKTVVRHKEIYQIIHGVKLSRSVIIVPLCGQKACLRPDHLSRKAAAV